MKAISSKSSKKVPRVGQQQKHYQGTHSKLLTTKCVINANYVIWSGWHIYWFICAQAFIVEPFQNWVAAHLHLPLLPISSAPLTSMKTHPLTLRLFLLISLYTTLLPITKSLQLLPVRGGLTHFRFSERGQKIVWCQRLLSGQWKGRVCKHSYVSDSCVPSC